MTGVGTLTWTNAGGVTADDNNYVSVTNSSGGTAQTHYLRATNFNFEIPVDATIDGIQVTIGRFVSVNQTGTDARDAVVSLIKAGSVTGSNLAVTGTDWPTSEGLATYGLLTSNSWGGSLDSG